MEKSNKFIADSLYKFADILEAGGDNPYRVRAYRRAARTLLNLDSNLAKLVEDNFDITTLPWIGKGIASAIHYILQKNEIPKINIKQNKKNINELKEIYGLGEKRIAALKQLNITTKKALIDAIRNGKLSQFKWFTTSLENKIKNDILHPKPKQFIRLYHAQPIVEIITQKLKEICDALCVTGKFRRKTEVLEQIDILVIAKNPEFVISKFINFKEVTDVFSQNEAHISVRVWSGIKLNLSFVPKNTFGAALIFDTGNKKHVESLVYQAANQNFSLTPNGLFKDEQCIASKNEAEIYQKLKLSYIEPELREGRSEIEAAAKNKLPHLIQLSDIKGDLHSHTNATDGKETLETMVQAAINRGYEYLAITDHSKRLAITNGLDEKRLLKQIKEIDKLNSKITNFLILKSIEVDILEDGTLDLSNDVLKELDIVVCSIHSKFRIPEEKQTARILKAMDNPYFNIFGHATGRLIKSRAPYPINFEKILKAAKERGCIIELNSQPYRLDINDIYCKMTKEMGVKVAISSDAHSTRELNYMQFGIYQARRGWLEKTDVINTLHWNDLKKIVRRI
ncbi:DNA polymerase/3'-5' exonuclease PolX [Legionella cardiaca]|uniref:PHP domain-containing protein n=1 Tax=Legionella cardiaca TaxID=1071983 RepID=A0ABY8ATW3_9GAMM|nr:DNA polymerase/3'-5' exonuclease PolX [Legionella cardiaca]WED44003.1 PHP domain-containing protein [Legionella cardiaca]